MPLLAALFCAIGILGAYVVAVWLIGVDEGNFWSAMQSQVDVWHDVGNGMVKAAVFGVICTFVALYQGYEAVATPGGVSYATTRGGDLLPAGAGHGLRADRTDVPDALNCGPTTRETR
jgi:phospholipid/cholesterol/gamma-HCH transport system permease protein